MTSSGLPELSGSQDLKYVFDALQPHSTDADATIFFTRYAHEGNSPGRADILHPFQNIQVGFCLTPLQADRVQSRQCGHQVQLLHPQPGPAPVLRSASQ